MVGAVFYMVEYVKICGARMLLGSGGSNHYRNLGNDSRDCGYVYKPIQHVYPVLETLR